MGFSTREDLGDMLARERDHQLRSHRRLDVLKSSAVLRDTDDGGHTLAAFDPGLRMWSERDAASKSVLHALSQHTDHSPRPGDEHLLNSLKSLQREIDRLFWELWPDVEEGGLSPSLSAEGSVQSGIGESKVLEYLPEEEEKILHLIEELTAGYTDISNSLRADLPTVENNIKEIKGRQEEIERLLEIGRQRGAEIQNGLEILEVG